jgi:Ca-activated chloride channel homolog
VNTPTPGVSTTGVGCLSARFALRVLAMLTFTALVGEVAQHDAAAAQVQTRQDSSAAPGVFKIEDNVNLVLLDVSVKDRRGGYVTGLNRSNFRVYEDGHPRNITQFDEADTPVTIGLVVDNSGSMRAKRPEVTLAGLAFARQSNPKDEFFVVNFNNSVVRGLPANMLFTDDLQILRAALYYGQPAGQTALYDAIAYALNHLELSHRDKRTLIVVSDGGDNASHIGLVELMKLIEASRAIIYTIGLYDPADHDLNPGVLRKIASISGGQFFEPERLSDVPAVFEKVSKDIRNCYTVGYVPNETNDKRVVRNVKVIAAKDNRKLLVRTRTTYITIPFSELSAHQYRKEGSRSEQ